MKFITLTQGTQMPLVGTGTNTYGKVNNEYRGDINNDTTELESAITAGYRHIDTAISYRNESVVGLAVEENQLPRSEFYLVSKLPNGEEYTADREAVIKGVQQSLDALRTDYIDLYLIHHPWDDFEAMVKVWKVLEEQVDKGIIKEIGVSNFDKALLDNILDNARIKPAVNQIQSHPGEWNHDIIKYSQSHDVVPVAWGPLSRIDEAAKQKLSEIGEQYGKTWAQVLLNYQVNRGVAVIPKSHNAERQAQNIDIFDFNLTDEEAQVIYDL